jgi:phosphatidylglycerophosphate synthase
MEQKDTTTRVQQSFLSKPERKILERIARVLPSWVTPDLLTLVGFLGAVFAGIGYILTNWGKGFLWIASLGFVVNWFGDSLDGTLARVRQIQRPTYGFFIDHNVDALTALVIGLGAGISPFVSLSVVLLILIGYYLLSIFTYINTCLRDIFKISYGGFGPTELRLGFIVLNALFFFLKTDNPPVRIIGITLRYFDLFALVVALFLFYLYFYFFLTAHREYKKIDPPHGIK